jgi:hypothetical protein
MEPTSMADQRHTAASELLTALDELQQGVDTFGWRGEPPGYPTEDDYNALTPLEGRVAGLAADLGLPAPPPLKLAGLVVNCRGPHLPGTCQGMYWPDSKHGDDREQSHARWQRELNVLRAAAEAIAGAVTAGTAPANGDKAAVNSLALAPGGFTYRGGRVINLSGRPLDMLRALLESRHCRCGTAELRQAMGVDDENVNYPEQVVKDTAKILRAALRKAVYAARQTCENPLPSVGRGKDLTYALHLP